MIRRIEDPSVIEGYLMDASHYRGRAVALVRPRTAEEVAEVLRHCQAADIPVTVTAARTSLTGASVPQGGWLLSMEHFDAVHDIGVDTATADAGVILGELQTEIERAGRLYPPDPTSRFECTLGASIACNASGARSFRYGPTRDWVEQLEVVLPTGEVLTVHRSDPIPADWPVPEWTEPPVKTAAGYAPPRSLLDLFIGHEGTLGVVTRATVRLTELPALVVGLLAWFPSVATAMNFARHARSAARADPHGPLSPRCIEYLDHNCLDLARQRLDHVPDTARAALFCEQEVDGDEHLEAWFDALDRAGALVDDTLVTTDDIGRARLHALRHAIPASLNERAAQLAMPKVATDFSVPDDAFPAMLEAYDAAPMEHALFGHLGDNHLHLNLQPTTPEELEHARSFCDALARKAIALGGSVSAEHGIGKLKKRHLAWMVGEDTLEQFRALKRHLDPAWVLGRGNLVDPCKIEPLPPLEQQQ